MNGGLEMALGNGSKDVQSSLLVAVSKVALPEKKYFKIGEVAHLVGVEPHVLRYWQTQFPQVRPQKSRSGHRLYRRKDVETLLSIKELLHVQRFTIAGARQALRSSVVQSEIPTLVPDAVGREPEFGSDDDVVDDDEFVSDVVFTARVDDDNAVVTTRGLATLGSVAPDSDVGAATAAVGAHAPGALADGESLVPSDRSSDDATDDARARSDRTRADRLSAATVEFDVAGVDGAELRAAMHAELNARLGRQEIQVDVVGYDDEDGDDPMVAALLARDVALRAPRQVPPSTASVQTDVVTVGVARPSNGQTDGRDGAAAVATQHVATSQPNPQPHQRSHTDDVVTDARTVSSRTQLGLGFSASAHAMLVEARDELRAMMRLLDAELPPERRKRAVTVR